MFFFPKLVDHNAKIIEICLALLFMVLALKLGGVLCLNNAKLIGICFPNLPII